MFPYRKAREFQLLLAQREKEMMMAKEQTLDSKEPPNTNVIENENQKDLIFTKMAKEKLMVRILNCSFL